jgi:cell division protein ZapA
MQTYEVKILDQQYKIRSDENEQYIQQLTEFVNGQITQAQQSAKTATTYNLAILAALNIADTLLKLQEENMHIKKEIKKKIKWVLDLIQSI